jgi:hypothetical protein
MPCGRLILLILWGKFMGFPAGIIVSLVFRVYEGVHARFQHSQLLLQAQDLLVLLDEHGEQHDLKWKQVRGVGRGGKVTAG